MLNESNIPLEEDGIEEEILVDEEVAITKAMWGDVGGNIENQTDLQNALDAKQDSLTEAQLNAVNSGITSEKVTTYDGYADQIASKADQSALNAESTARGEADTALGTRIDNEVLARQQADNGLQSQIDAITSKSDVVDVVANYAALQAYDTSTLGNNDVVKVLDDETHEDALTYYRWSTTTQTWAYIGQEAPYYSKGQMDVKLAEKQDKLTAGANIQIQNGTISATDTKYTNGNGLNLNGTEFSADTDVLATKEDLEGYYTKPETDNLLAPKLEAEVVAELPATGTEGKLYLTPKAHTTSTATGNPIEATVTEQAGQLESFQLDGDTFQQTYTGKNLLNYNTIRQTRLNGVTLSLADDGTITLDGTCSADNTRFGFDDLSIVLDGTYTLSFEVISGTIANAANSTEIRLFKSGYSGGLRVGLANTSASNTLSASGNYVLNDIRIDNGVVLTNYKIKIQLEKSATATSFEPFVGGQPSPNPDYPQNIQVVTGKQTVKVLGKNLLNITSPMREFTEAGLHITIADDGKITIDGTATNAIWPDFIWGIQSNTAVHYQCKYYFPKALEAATFSIKIVNGTATGNPSFSVVYDDNGDKNVNIRFNELQPKTATDVKGINRAYLSNIQSGVTFDNFQFYVQVERGTTATEVVPYSELDYEIDLGDIELCKLDTYQDYIYKDGDDWKVHKATAIVSASNREWKWVNISPNGWYFSQTNYGHYDINKINVISKSFIGVKRSVAPNTSWAFITMAGDGSIGIRNPNMTGSSNVTQFTNWLNSLNTTWLYALTTPTDTAITDTTLIAQLEAIRTASLENGTNTITNTAIGTNLAGDMEIGYFGLNPTNRYDKFIWLDLNNNYEQIGGE